MLNFLKVWSLLIWWLFVLDAVTSYCPVLPATLFLDTGKRKGVVRWGRVGVSVRVFPRPVPLGPVKMFLWWEPQEVLRSSAMNRSSSNSPVYFSNSGLICLLYPENTGSLWHNLAFMINSITCQIFANRHVQFINSDAEQGSSLVFLMHTMERIESLLWRAAGLPCRGRRKEQACYSSGREWRCNLHIWDRASAPNLVRE